MAVLPGTACHWPGCPEIVKDPSGYCEAHRKQAQRARDAHRPSSRQRGYNGQWEKFRAWYCNQAGTQYCWRCLELKGEIIKSEVIHHIIPIEKRPDLRLVEDNCMPLCRQCHEEIHGRA